MHKAQSQLDLQNLDRILIVEDKIRTNKLIRNDLKVIFVKSHAYTILKGIPSVAHWRMHKINWN